MKNYTEKKLIANEIVTCAILIKVLTLRKFKECGFEITPEQFVLLDTLAQNDNICQRKLGMLIGKDRANVTRLLNILQKKGLIEKTADLKRKANRLQLTLEGRKVKEKIEPVMLEIRDSYLKDIKTDELLQCFGTLNKIKEVIAKNTKLRI